jgi:DNA-binding response OmpR family regulator
MLSLDWASAKPQRLEKGSHRMGPPASLPRILIVEADRAIANLLHFFLGEEGYEVELASSLEEASTILGTQTYQLILLDLFHRVPRQIFLTAEQLQERCKPTPVGLLFSWDLPAEEVQRQRFAFVLPKPFDLDQLLSAVATAVQTSGFLGPKSGHTDALSVFSL